MNDLISIARQFIIEGTIVSVKPFGSGHINDSFLVKTLPEAAPDYVLQRINHTIFRNIPDLTDNILKVTQHIRQQLHASESISDTFQVIRLIQAHSGSFFIHDEEGNFWRLYNHVRGSKSYDIVANPDLAYEGGKAFGIFQYLTSGIDASSLHEILPDFHNIAKRISTFRETVLRNPAGRLNEVINEIAFVEARSEQMHAIMRLGEQGYIPVRVTHNDTKFNNILFNQDNKAISIVDLDTVMPGYVLYDFGDAIRTGSNMAAEDEADLAKVNIDLHLFEAYSKGYLGIARKFLHPAEISHLAFSAKFMTYIIGLTEAADHEPFLRP